MMEWIVAAIAVVGVILNVRKKWQCFLCWMFTNAFWFGRNINIGEYAQAVTFAVFFAVSFYGMIAWRICKKEKDDIRQATIWICEKLLLAKALIDEPEKIRVSIDDIIKAAGDLYERIKNGKEEIPSDG